VLTDVASQIVLALQAGAPEGQVHELLAGEPAHWAEVHQATGMISAQLDVGVDEAFVRLRAHAFAEHLALRDIARDVVGRRLRLEASS
jgi:AmiR/NasT family two-component response regulator